MTRPVMIPFFVCNPYFNWNKSGHLPISFVDVFNFFYVFTERVRDTLIHELCHAAVWFLNGVNDGHGPHWKYWYVFIGLYSDVVFYLVPGACCHQMVTVLSDIAQYPVLVQDTLHFTPLGH